MAETPVYALFAALPRSYFVLDGFPRQRAPNAALTGGPACDRAPGRLAVSGIPAAVPIPLSLDNTHLSRFAKMRTVSSDEAPFGFGQRAGAHGPHREPLAAVARHVDRIHSPEGSRPRTSDMTTWIPESCFRTKFCAPMARSGPANNATSQQRGQVFSLRSNEQRSERTIRPNPRCLFRQGLSSVSQYRKSAQLSCR